MKSIVLPHDLEPRYTGVCTESHRKYPAAKKRAFPATGIFFPQMISESLWRACRLLIISLFRQQFHTVAGNKELSPDDTQNCLMSSNACDVSRSLWETTCNTRTNTSYWSPSLKDVDRGKNCRLQPFPISNAFGKAICGCRELSRLPKYSINPSRSRNELSRIKYQRGMDGAVMCKLEFLQTTRRRCGPEIAPRFRLHQNNSTTPRHHNTLQKSRSSSNVWHRLPRFIGVFANTCTQYYDGFRKSDEPSTAPEIPVAHVNDTPKSIFPKSRLVTVRTALWVDLARDERLSICFVLHFPHVFIRWYTSVHPDQS